MCSGDPWHVQLLDGRAASPAVFLDKGDVLSTLPVGDSELRQLLPN